MSASARTADLAAHHPGAPAAGEGLREGLDRDRAPAVVPAVHLGEGSEGSGQGRIRSEDASQWL